MVIGGAACEASTGERFEVKNPATGRVVALAPKGGRDDVERAVGSAASAQRAWAALPARQRAGAMNAMAQALRAHADELAWLLTLEMGRPLPQARNEVEASASLLDYYAAEALRVEGRVLQSDDPDRLVLVEKVPVGAVAAISPWNYPLALLFRMAAPALAAGCSVIAKPSSLAPVAVLRSAEVIAALHLVRGLFNAVTGSGETVGEDLVQHPKVSKIALTGGLEAGRKVYRLGSHGIRRFTLELGGQCAAIVFADSDLRRAAAAVTFQAFRNSGQLCNRVNRLYVEEPAVVEFLKHLKDFAGRIVVGDGMREGVDVGPLISEEHLNRVHSHVLDAVSHGAELLAGGQRLAGEGFDKGSFYPPTILTRCGPEMLVMKEETFGPVVGVAGFKEEEEAVELANSTLYGLSAFVFSGDVARALRVARKMEAGSVWVNDIHGSFIQCPYGGMKQSGLGREQGREGIEEYLEVRTLYLDVAEARSVGRPLVHE